MKKILLILFSTSLLFGGDGFLKKVWARLNDLTTVSPEQVAKVDHWMTQRTRVLHYDAKTGTYRIETYVPYMPEVRRVRFFDDALNVWRASHTTFEVFRTTPHNKEE